jgi:hypothetical protein
MPEPILGIDRIMDTFLDALLPGVEKGDIRTVTLRIPLAEPVTVLVERIVMLKNIDLATRVLESYRLVPTITTSSAELILTPDERPEGPDAERVLRDEP